MEPENIIQQDSSTADYEQEIRQILEPAAAPPQQAQKQNTVLQMENRVKEVAAKDMQTIQSLVQAKIINPQQGQNLINHVVKQAFDAITTQTGLVKKPEISTVSQEPQEVQAIENSEFFNQKGRSEVLDYLKKSSAIVDKDEISQITKLIESIENCAIERYLKKQDYEKTLNDENEAAKQKLSANAQKSNSGDTKNTVFTRDQIGKMSGTEFVKNEHLIMEQLKKGLIR